MTTRRRTGARLTPERLAELVSTELRQAPPTTPEPGLSPAAANERLIEGYRSYADDLADELYGLTRRDDPGLVVAVAEVLGTDPASWFRSVIPAVDGGDPRSPLGE